MERFINICIRRQIYLWDIHKVNSGTIKLRMSIKGFKAARSVIHKTRCRMKIMEKKGLPFILHRYRKRKAFMLGILIFLGLIWYMTSFIWVVEINGYEKILKEEIEAQLQHCGLKVGAFKMGLDVVTIENEMMLKEDRLSWIGVEVKGTKAIVEIKERRKPPQILEKHIPCNIVGAKGGVIRNMLVKSGHPVVKEGDTVEKGQLLVSGVIDSQVEGIRYIHSVASVKARTWYEKSKEIPLSVVDKNKTGESVTKYALKFFDYKINLSINSGIPYANYDKITDSKDLAIGDKYIFPISLESETFEELSVEKRSIELEQAIAEGTQQLREELLEELDVNAELLEETVDHIFIDDQHILLKLTAECIEEIGVQEKIVKSEE